MECIELDLEKLVLERDIMEWEARDCDEQRAFRREEGEERDKLELRKSKLIMEKFAIAHK